MKKYVLNALIALSLASGATAQAASTPDFQEWLESNKASTQTVLNEPVALMFWRAIYCEAQENRDLTPPRCANRVAYITDASSTAAIKSIDRQIQLTAKEAQKDGALSSITRDRPRKPAGDDSSSTANYTITQGSYNMAIEVICRRDTAQSVICIIQRRS